jgi:hypothetical protein
MRQILRTAAAGLAACGLTALAIAATDAQAIAGTKAAASHCISVKGSGSTVSLSRTKIRNGTVCFAVSSANRGLPGGGGGSSVNMFQPKHGVSLARALNDFKDEFSSKPATAAKGTRELVRDVLFFGLADVVRGHPETVTDHLGAGTYYVWDPVSAAASGKPPVLTKLTVTRGGTFPPLTGSVVVAATSADRFIAPGIWPHQGTYLFHNVADTIHFMQLIPVKPGTTDAQIQAFFNSHSKAAPSFFAAGPSGGNDVVSPGRFLQVAYNLPRGTYVLMCFVADDVTGMPHALMGMHMVIELT